MFQLPPVDLYHHTGAEFLVRRGTYDKQVVDEVMRGCYSSRVALSPDQVWLDIGGNIGCFAVEAARAGCRVVSVEPEPTNAELARRNVEANNLGQLVTVVERAAALSGCESTVLSMNTKTNKGSHTTVREMRGRKSIEVQTASVDLLAADHGCSHLKIDCEGAEYEILLGMRWRPEVIVGEYHFAILQDKDWTKYRRFIKALESAGYTYDGLDPDYPNQTWHTIFTARR